MIRGTQKIFHQPFIIMEFTNWLNENETTDIDIIPKDWIFYDDKEQSCKTPYPSPPYNDQCCQLLHARVKKRLPPLSNWPTWTVSIKGSGSK